jgi:O-antigen ligase
MLSEPTGLLEPLFCVFAISVFMGAYIALPLKLAGSTLAFGEANPLNTACQTLILLGLAVFCALRWRRVVFVALQGKVLLLFILLAAASLTWSAAPDVTLRRVVTLSTAVAFAWYACASFPMEWTIRVLAFTSLVSGAASVGVALILPRAGVMTGSLAGSWNGVYTHKNELGWAMIIGVLAYGWLWMQRPRRRVRYGLAIAFCCVVAVLSRSKTAQVSIALLPVIGCWVRAFKRPGIARLWAVYGLAAGVTAGAALGAFIFGDVMVLLGKDPSLTGRVPLWSALADDIAQRPILGYGYGAYFLDWSPRLQWVERLIQWTASEAHDAYIELVLQLGVVGLVLGVWPLLATLRLALSGPLRDDLPWASYAAVYAISFAVSNLVETMLMRAGDVHSMILPLLYVGLRTEVARRRGAARAMGRLALSAPG